MGERPKLTQEDIRDVFGVGQNVLVRAGTKWEPREILGITVLRHSTHCPHCGGELLGEPRFWFKDHGNVPLEEVIAREDIGPVIPMVEQDKSGFATFYLIDLKTENGKLFWRWTRTEDEWKEVTDIHSFLTTYYPPAWRSFILKTMGMGIEE